MKYKVSVNNRELDVTLLSHTEGSVAFQVNGTCYEVGVTPVFEQTQHSRINSEPVSQPAPVKTKRVRSGEIAAPMPGVIVSIAVKEGATVTLGAPLLVMEAMKMENLITASASGVVKKIHVKAGQQVENGQVLVSIEAA